LQSITVARFLASGDADPRYDTFHDATAQVIAARGATFDADGGLVLAGYLRTSLSVFRTPAMIALYRIGVGGRRDDTFGSGGRIVVPLGDDITGAAADVALDPLGRLVVFASTLRYGERVTVLRLLPDGRPDETFAAQGRTSFWELFGTSATAGAVSSDGRIVVAARVEDKPPILINVVPIIGPVYERSYRMALFRLHGGTAARPFETEQGRLFEFFHPTFGHYFITGLQSETSWLDANADWIRTGRSFRSWTQPAADTRGVCRFFSDATFAPKSSHFYTPYTHECAGLNAGAVWKYEGEAFQLRLPEGAAGSRTCSVETQPLYRAYNNGQGGAPNHRYTTDPSVLDQMVAQGWIMEGEAQTRIFACVPLQ
jgi:hypothetical protein